MTTKTIIRRIAKGLGFACVPFVVGLALSMMLIADHWAWPVTAVAIMVMAVAYMIGEAKEERP